MKTAIVLIIAMATPLILPYAIYGKRQNGYIVYRYPNSTEVVKKNNSTYYTTIIGSDECTPLYTRTTIPGPNFCISSKNKLTPEDLTDWKKALDQK